MPAGFSDWHERLVPLLREAGAAIMQVYSQPQVHWQAKADASPVTQADLAAHRIITLGLARDWPWPVLSEEGPPQQLAQRQSWREYWLLDPLDGTQEFLARNGEFAIALAWVEAEQARYGLVYHPPSDTTYFGGPAGGAFKQQGDQAPVPLRCRLAQPQQPLVALHSRRRADTALEQLRGLAPYWPGGVLQKPLGSALKICRIAEGLADVYLRLGATGYWDTAAAQAILQGAGGDILDSRWQSLRYPLGEQCLNGDFFACGDLRMPWQELMTQGQQA
jgi:3'(2'), 5'-bisphosphate nucleotidase